MGSPFYDYSEKITPLPSPFTACMGVRRTYSRLKPRGPQWGQQNFKLRIWINQIVDKYQSLHRNWQGRVISPANCNGVGFPWKISYSGNSFLWGKSYSWTRYPGGNFPRGILGGGTYSTGPVRYLFFGWGIMGWGVPKQSCKIWANLIEITLNILRIYGFMRFIIYLNS